MNAPEIAPRDDWLADQLRQATKEASSWSPRKRESMRFDRIRSSAADDSRHEWRGTGPARVEAARGFAPTPQDDIWRKRSVWQRIKAFCRRWWWELRGGDLR